MKGDTRSLDSSSHADILYQTTLSARLEVRADICIKLVQNLSQGAPTADTKNPA